jgi:adenylate kinase
MDLVLFGIQGSGKGTQAKRLAAEFKYDIFEAGGELRKIAASGSALGQTVKSYIDVGKLVPFEIIMQVVKEAILARPRTQKILFDGIPRDMDQMRSFDEIMAEVERNFQCILINLPTEEAVRRILGRAKKERRADDANEETIRRRMATFLEKTLPAIEEYKRGGKLIEVDGEGPVEEVYERLTRAMRDVESGE